jgi:hypothetical protein
MKEVRESEVHPLDELTPEEWVHIQQEPLWNGKDAI